MRKATGFTIVELVMVIVMVGILGTMAAARFIDTQDIGVPAYAEEARGLMRFGQRLAIAQNRPIWVSLSAGKVALCYDSSCASKVQAAGGANSGRSTTTAAAACGNATWACEGQPVGITVAAGTSVFAFDAKGRPYNSSDDITSDSSSFNTLTVTVSGGGSTATVTVEKETGYVH
jgi:MSHA pilin protein MshC